MGRIHTLVGAIALANSVSLAGANAGDFTTSFNENRGRQRVSSGTSLSCKGIADALLYEDRVAKKTVTARGAAGTDMVSMKIASDGRSVSFLTAASMRGGATEGSQLPIVTTTDRFIVAARLDWPLSDVVVLDLDSGNAVWSSTGFFMPGLTGQSVYLQCR